MPSTAVTLVRKYHSRFLVLADMKRKNHPRKVRVSKVPPKPSSMATRVLNVMANFKYMQGGKGETCESTEDSDHLTLVEVFGRSRNNVEETEEGNEPIIVEVEDNTMTSIVPETPNSCDVDGYNDKDVAPDTTDEVIDRREKHFLLNSPSTLDWGSWEISDWTEQGFCIKCNKGDDQVLICSGYDCVIGVHVFCLGCTPSIDDSGNFFCPLCSYKQAVSELYEVKKEAALAKEKAHLARNSCALFVCRSNKKESTERICERELNQLRMGADSNSIGLPEDQQEATNATGCSNGNLGKETSLASERNDILLTREGDSGKQVGRHQQEAVVAVGNLMKEKSYVSESCDTLLSRGKRSRQVEYHHYENIENQQEAVAADGNLGVETSMISERSDASHGGHHAEQVDDRPCETVVELMCRGDLPLLCEFGCPLPKTKENETRMVEEDQHPEEGDQQMQTEANIGFENRNSPCKETETVSVHTERATQNTVLQPRIVDPVEKSPSDASIDENKTASRESMRSYKSAKCPSNPALPNSRRKTLPWTPEEEEMLKKAVKEFSSKATKTMQWKNILEFGRHVFNASRTPIDLKDKWRNMERSRARQR